MAISSQKMPKSISDMENPYHVACLGAWDSSREILQDLAYYFYAIPSTPEYFMGNFSKIIQEATQYFRIPLFGRDNQEIS